MTLEEALAECRKETAEEVFAMASKIANRDHWHIGGFLGEVMEEWEANQ